MLAEIQSGGLAGRRDAHPDHAVGDPVEQHADDEGVGDDDRDAGDGGDELHEARVGPGDQPGLREHAGEYGRHDAADAVGGEDVERVVDAGVRLPVDRHVADEGGEEGDGERLADRDDVGARRDRHQADHRAHGGAHAGRLAPAQAVEEHPRHHRRGAGGVGVEERLDRGAVRRQRRAAVEAEPAEPQHRRAEDDERDVRRQGRRIWRLGAAAEEERARERRHAGGGVHDDAPREVVDADAHQVVEESVRMPRPVRERAVDEHAEEHHEHEVGREAHALGEGAGDERRGDDRELHLEEREERERNGGRDRLVHLRADVPEHEELRRASDEPEPADVVAEAQREAHDHPEDGDDAHGDEALEDRGDHVLAPDHAAVEEREAWRHHQHEDRRGDHPGDVRGVELLVRLPDAGRLGEERPDCRDQRHQTH